MYSLRYRLKKIQKEQETYHMQDNNDNGVKNNEKE